MNREILFRGKFKETGEWVNGWFSLDGAGRSNIIKSDCPNKEWWHEVIPESVGQFTGLTDKNGTKIFEDDILIRNLTGLHGKNDDKVFCKNWQRVFYKDGGFVGYWFREWPNYFRTPTIDLGTFAKEFEVIGNVTDNPELLK